MCDEMHRAKIARLPIIFRRRRRKMGYNLSQGTENFSALNIVYLATKRREIKTWNNLKPGGQGGSTVSQIHDGGSVSMGSVVSLHMVVSETSSCYLEPSVIQFITSDDTAVISNNKCGWHS